MKIVVVGAGLSGLAAARRMRDQGHEVVVLEAADQAGGRCRLETRNNVIASSGFIVDTGPELAATSYRHWLAMAKAVGLEDDIVKSPTVLSVLKNGVPVEIDAGKPLAAMFTSLISMRGKLQFAKGLMSLMSRIRAVPTFLLDGTALDDELRTGLDIALKAFGPEVTYQVIEPVLRPLGGTRLDLISTLLVPYALGEWNQMLSLKGGLQRLPIAVAATLDVRYNVSVRRIHSDPDGVRLEVDTAHGPDVITADKCLISAQFDDAQKMYPRLRDISNGYADTMEFLRLLDVKLAYDRRPATRAGMVMCPFRESRDINLISLSHNKSPDRAPAGHSLFSIYTEHLEFDRLNAMTDTEVIATIAPQVEKLFPELKDARRLFTLVGRYPRVCMVPTPGFFIRTRQLWDAVGEEPRVHLAGDIFNFGSMEAAVSTGDVAADRLMAR